MSQDTKPSESPATCPDCGRPPADDCDTYVGDKLCRRFAGATGESADADCAAHAATAKPAVEAVPEKALADLRELAAFADEQLKSHSCAKCNEMKESPCGEFYLAVVTKARTEDAIALIRRQSETITRLKAEIAEYSRALQLSGRVNTKLVEAVGRSSEQLCDAELAGYIEGRQDAERLSVQESEPSFQSVLNKICGDLPNGFYLDISCENGAAWVELQDWELGGVELPDSADRSMLQQVDDALDAARKRLVDADAKGEAK